VKEGDAVVLDVRVRDEHGREIPELTHADVFFKEPNRSLPKPVYEALLDMKKEDRAEVKLERERKNPKGEIVSRHDTYGITLKEIKVIQLPTLDDEFAKDVGDFKNLSELRTHLQANLEKQEKERQRSEALSKMYEHLIAKIPFEAPASLVAAYQIGMIREDSERLARMGLKLSDMGEEAKQYMERKAEDSTRLVKTLLLLAEIAKLQKIEATDEDVDKEIERMAVMANRKPLAIRARLEAEKRLEGLKDDILNEKVAEFLFTNANVQYTAA
jgi:trigger factor